MSGASRSGRVLRNAFKAFGSIVAGPVLNSQARAMAMAVRSARINRRNGPKIEARPSQPDLQMIAQVLADREIDQRRNADLLQMLGRTYTGQHQ